jgi:hypothetical protein
MAFFVSGALRYPGAFAVAWKFALYIYISICDVLTDF